MKKISLSVLKKIILSLALSGSFIFLSEKSDAQNNSPETVAVNANGVSKNNASVSADALKDVIRIQNNNGTLGIARVYSQSGKKVSENILQAGVNAIDVSFLLHGNYIICITLDGGETYRQSFDKK